jgi:hypothetical protein
VALRTRSRSTGKGGFSRRDAVDAVQVDRFRVTTEGAEDAEQVDWGGRILSQGRGGRGAGRPAGMGRVLSQWRGGRGAGRLVFFGNYGLGMDVCVTTLVGMSAHCQPPTANKFYGRDCPWPSPCRRGTGRRTTANYPQPTTHNPQPTTHTPHPTPHKKNPHRALRASARDPLPSPSGRPAPRSPHLPVTFPYSKWRVAISRRIWQPLKLSLRNSS